MLILEYSQLNMTLFGAVEGSGLLNLTHFTVCYFSDDPDDQYNLYMQYVDMYPRAQAPKRMPLSFTTGMFSFDITDVFYLAKHFDFKFQNI